jgi:hypothetical protein
MRSWVAAFEVDSSVTPALALDMAARRKTAIKAKDIPAITKTLIKRIEKIFLITIISNEALRVSCGVSYGVL